MNKPQNRSRGQLLPLVEAEVVNPRQLPSAEQKRFLANLFQIHEQIFRNVSETQFEHYTLRPDAARTRVQLYRNQSGDLVGYCAIHLFEVPLQGKIVAILRTEAGLLPNYRGSSATLWFGAKEALRYKLHHPFRSLALFTTLVHPSSYHMLCKFVWRCYPYPGRHMSRKWQAMLETLIAWAGYDAGSLSDPLIRKVGWITQETHEEARKWAESKHEDVRYFVSRNPHYTEGYGLAWIAPMTLLNIAVTSVVYVWYLLSRTFR